MELFNLTEEAKMVYTKEKMLKDELEIMKKCALMESRGLIKCIECKDLDKYKNKLIQARSKYNCFKKLNSKYFCN